MTAENTKIPQLSALERAKTLLVLLEMQRKTNPEKIEFYFLPERMLSPLRDQFEMEKALEILNKETRGNVAGKYELSDVYINDEKIGFAKKLFVRIKDAALFEGNYKKVFAKRDRSPENKVFKIEIFEPDDGIDGSLHVYINGDYSNREVLPKKRSDRWAAMLRIADERSIDCKSRKEARAIIDYFNSTPGNVLYSHTQYQPPQRILMTEDEGGKTVYALIPIELLSKDVPLPKPRKKRLKGT
jgi:hypothetical protein